IQPAASAQRPQCATLWPLSSTDGAAAEFALRAAPLFGKLSAQRLCAARADRATPRRATPRRTTSRRTTSPWTAYITLSRPRRPAATGTAIPPRGPERSAGPPSELAFDDALGQRRGAHGSAIVHACAGLPRRHRCCRSTAG